MDSPSLWTIGHSNHDTSTFLGLLVSHSIDVLVDVRSSPYSRYSPHFNREVLKGAVTKEGIRYVFLGRELGGRPASDEAYDDEGHARYDVMSTTPEFRSGIERLLEGLHGHRVAMMCSEESPEDCHRRLLIGKVLTDRGSCVLQHIRGDARVEVEDAVDLGDAQLNLLGETPPWRSTQSVSQRSRPASSSTY